MNGIPVTLAGNITHDPEAKPVPNGSLLTFSVAVERSYRNRDSEWMSQVSFVDVKAWGRVAEDAGAPGLLTKGTPVIVTGRLEQETWESEDGGKRSKLIVTADAVAVNVRGIETFERKRREPTEQSNGRPQRQMASASAGKSFEDEPF